MAPPPVEEIRYVVATVVCNALDDLIENQRRTLELAAHDWWPDADPLTRRETVDRMVQGVRGLAGMVDRRRNEQVVVGRATQPRGGP